MHAWSDLFCKMHDAPFIMYGKHAWCVMHLLRLLMYVAWCILHNNAWYSNVYWQGWRLHFIGCVHDASCIMHDAYCIMHDASWIMHDASSIMADAWCIFHYAWFFLHDACLMICEAPTFYLQVMHAWCLFHAIWCIIQGAPKFHYMMHDPPKYYSQSWNIPSCNM